MRLLIATSFLLLSGCVTDAVTPAVTDAVTPAATYKSGDEISLQVGQSAPVDGRWIISFAGVTEESRCPMNARCVWAGNARIALTIREVGNAFKPIRFELNTNDQFGSTAALLSAAIELKRLEPTPMAGAPTGDYVATLVVKARK